MRSQCTSQDGGLFSYPFGRTGACPIRGREASELELQRQLDRSWSADLIERIESAVRPACAQKVRKGLSGTAEQRAGQEVGGTPKVGNPASLKRAATLSAIGVVEPVVKPDFTSTISL